MFLQVSVHRGVRGRGVHGGGVLRGGMQGRVRVWFFGGGRVWLILRDTVNERPTGMHSCSLIFFSLSYSVPNGVNMPLRLSVIIYISDGDSRGGGRG